jgi:hypothetical protein
MRKNIEEEDERIRKRLGYFLSVGWKVGGGRCTFLPG